MDTGSLHYIQYVENLDSIDINKQGKIIRNNSALFPKGTNVNFVQTSNKSLRIRTYERGVESETLACGTGTVAAAIASKRNAPDGQYSVLVDTLGGQLEVKFMKKENKFSNVYLIGPASFVFSGEYIL